MADVQKTQHGEEAEVPVPPPSYDLAVHDTETPLRLDSVQISTPQPSKSQPQAQISSSFRPIVIPRKSPSSNSITILTQSPETSAPFRGAFFSPFTRVYVPCLEALPSPIPQKEFLAFLDGLNEAFVAAPAFRTSHSHAVPLPIALPTLHSTSNTVQKSPHTSAAASQQG